MKPRLKSTSAARDLIKRFEPFLAVAERGADGRFVVGYGHRASAREDVSVNEESADLLLIYDVLQAEKAIDETITEPLGAPQRDALVSFALGVGLGAFRQSATARLINRNRWRDAAEAIAAWGGGMSPRRAAEKELFLTNLPEDADERPVELVIEFEHPDRDDDAVLVPPVAPDAGEAVENDTADESGADLAASDEETADEPEIESEPGTETDTAPEAQTEPETEPDSEPETVLAAPVAAMAGRDEITARVIARMREQIAPRRPLETALADAAPEDADEDAAETVDDEAVAESDVELPAANAAEVEDDQGGSDETPAAPALGFVFSGRDSESAEDTAMPVEPDLGDDEAPEDNVDDTGEVAAEEVEASDSLDAAANDVDAPPMLTGDTPARARGATGEAGGLDAANDLAEELRDAEDEHATLADDLPEPAEIDPSLVPEDEPAAPAAGGWRNGDSSAAPAPSSGRWGTIAVFAVGLLTMVAGVVETITRLDHYLETRTLLFGPAAAVAGFILFSGAAITLLGRVFAPKEVERKSGPLP
ncbi:glycoside hydrolase family protein [Hyphobacterium marinum]|uniref:Lysozyme n=1 Tax=Hyphobacterium marinum TaxID=3116574 RepID=A0ABU7M0E0_9PROT|nr:glycoside hydrolase family protein [Hyphobacterium sp. Y6023]MEE2567245.1 glycoside hydrolase family protein [Hyphobacterium sp. Y6023]